MGTSVNQASPRTLNWQSVHAGYRNPDVPIARIAAEVWRAAMNQPSGNLAELLSHSIVLELGFVASRSRTATEASRNCALTVARSKQSSLGTEIARRAALQAYGTENVTVEYAAKLFGEATGYLVSRDFPGFVGSGRARNVADSLAFKAEVVRHVSDVAKSLELPARLDVGSWRRHIESVVKHLRETSR